MADFRPEEWVQNGDVIWLEYLNMNLTHAMLAQFWTNDEATDEEAAAFVLRACRSYKSMLALLEKALPIIEAEAEQRQNWGERHNREGHRYATEMREIADEIQAEIDKAYGREVKHG